MKEYLIQFKPFLLFLTKFIFSYLILSILYQTYLNQYDVKNFEVDGITESVAKQSNYVLSRLNPDSFILPNLEEPSVKLYYHGKWVARIIEGCNAISIMILFVSFVFAFAGKIKQMVVFILSGIIIIELL